MAGFSWVDPRASQTGARNVIRLDQAEPVRVGKPGQRGVAGAITNLPTMTQAHAARGNRLFSTSGQTRRRYS